jgi:tetratricopeptide (TPR) repeat protein
MKLLTSPGLCAKLLTSPAYVQNCSVNPIIHSALQIVHYERDEFDEAVAHYRRAIAVAPSYAEAYSNLSNALRARKSYDEALIAYRQAPQLRPAYAEAINNMGAGEARTEADSGRRSGGIARADTGTRQPRIAQRDGTGALRAAELERSPWPSSPRGCAKARSRRRLEQYREHPKGGRPTQGGALRYTGGSAPRPVAPPSPMGSNVIGTLPIAG